MWSAAGSGLLRMDGGAVLGNRRRRKLQTANPFPCHTQPTAEDCASVRNDLLNTYGFRPDLEKYRRLRLVSGGYYELSNADGSCLKESVLDGLIRIVLSQNTTDTNSERAFAGFIPLLGKYTRKKIRANKTGDTLWKASR